MQQSLGFPVRLRRYAVELPKPPKLATPRPESIPSFTNRLQRDDWHHSRLYMDDRFSISLTDLFNSEMAWADIAIVISYQPWFLSFGREKVFRFVTRKE